MNKDILILRAVEMAAIAAYKYVGLKDKNQIDNAAVEALNEILSHAQGYFLKVVNGEGELDKAPMLYVNQTYGDQNSLYCYDISVDPIEGTFPAAYNFAGSISTIGVSKLNTMLQLPEMYMEKLFVSSALTNMVDLSLGIEQNIKNFQSVLNRKDIRCIILDKPRHQQIIKKMIDLGVIVRTIQDGDVLASIDVVNDLADFVYGIGGAPEGSLMACLAISSNCKMQVRLIHYDQIWPNEEETNERVAIEKTIIEKLNLSLTKIYNDLELVADNKCRFFASGITAGGSLKPINYKNGVYFINSFFSSHGVVRNIFSSYNIDKIIELKSSVKNIIDKYKR